MIGKLSRPLGLCIGLLLPAVVCRFAGVPLPPLAALVVFGMAVVAAAFVLAWAAEAAQRDISSGLAIALLALVAVLPEYAVDLYFAYTAGSNPEFVGYAAANMTGSNRLLLGLGWSLVVLIALFVASKRAGKRVKYLVLDARYRMELGFLAIASLVAFLIPLTGQIHLVLGVVLLGVFLAYMWRMSGTGDREPELVGPAALVGGLPRAQRRALVIGMFAVAAVAILAAAEPFAHALINTGRELGMDEFLLVQWLAPLASESPEFIVAILFACNGKAVHAIGTLIASKVNQYTLLVGSLPVTYLIGGGGSSMVLDTRQVEEFLLTATQTVLGIAVLLSLRFPRWAALTLLGLFALQFVFPGQTARYVLCGVYAGLAVAALVYHRRHIVDTLRAPLRKQVPAPAPERELTGVS